MNTKINHTELKKLYSEHFKSTYQFSNKDCPSVETIHRYLRSALPRREKNNAIKHMITCYACLNEVKFIISILEEEKNFISRIRELQKKNSSPASEKVKSAIRKKPTFIKIAWLHTSILVFLLFIISIIKLKNNINLSPEKYRGNRLYGYELIVDSKLKGFFNKIELMWGPIPASKYYIIEIFDESLSLIWKSDEIYNNQLSISQSVLDNRKSRKYFCIITAFLPYNKKIESTLQEIKLQ